MDIALLPTINLSNATSSLDSDADVEVSKSLSSQKENGLNSLHLHTLGLHDVNGLTVQLHDSVAVLAVSNGNSGLLNHRLDKIEQNTVVLHHKHTLRPKACTEGLASVDILRYTQL